MRFRRYEASDFPVVEDIEAPCSKLRGIPACLSIPAEKRS